MRRPETCTPITVVCDAIDAAFPNCLCNNSFRDTRYGEVYGATFNLIYINGFRCRRHIRLTLATASAAVGSPRYVGTDLAVYFETGLAFQFDRRHGIASAHAICPSKPSSVAMAR
jgi:hypothetical protein